MYKINIGSLNSKLAIYRSEWQGWKSIVLEKHGQHFKFGCNIFLKSPKILVWIAAAFPGMDHLIFSFRFVRNAVAFVSSSIFQL